MIIGIIPAKGDSSRLPRKNMIEIHGKPLILFTLEYARRSKILDDIYVTSDNQDIIDFCKKQKVKIIKRPKHLCGETPIIDVYKHAFIYLKNIKISSIIGLQPDHPDRYLEIDDVYKIYTGENCDHLISKEKNGTKNGAHYILSRNVLMGNKPKKIFTVIDDCTNVHYKEDLKKVEKNLKLKI